MPREGSGAGEQAVPPVNAEPAVPSVNAKQNVPPVAHAQPSPSSAGEALQARLDAVICVHLLDRNPAGGMQVIRNCFTSCDGKAMRQFVVSATGGVRCAICCGDASFARSSRTPPLTQLHDMKKHCGQVRERGESALEPQTRAHLVSDVCSRARRPRRSPNPRRPPSPTRRRSPRPRRRRRPKPRPKTPTRTTARGRGRARSSKSSGPRRRRSRCRGKAASIGAW